VARAHLTLLYGLRERGGGQEKERPLCSVLVVCAYVKGRSQGGGGEGILRKITRSLLALSLREKKYSGREGEGGGGSNVSIQTSFFFYVFFAAERLERGGGRRRGGKARAGFALLAIYSFLKPTIKRGY